MAAVVVLGVQCAKALAPIDETSHSKISLVITVEMFSEIPPSFPTCVCVELMRSGVEPSVESYQTSTCVELACVGP
eukprot:COSAG02_NODE_2182_length_9582_cov_4.266582_3_plen_76_part_00